MDRPKYYCANCGSEQHPTEAHETSQIESEGGKMHVEFGAAIDNKAHGQDHYFMNTEQRAIGVFDGVSVGPGDGGRAARLAGSLGDKSMSTVARQTDTDDNKLVDLEYDMAKVLRGINEQIRNARDGGEDIGDTMATIAKVVEDQGRQKVVWAHVGDSRIYHIRGNTITRISADDTPVGELFKRGMIIMDKADNHPRRNEYNLALGAEQTIAPQQGSFELEDGDVVMLTTDGIHDVLYDLASVRERKKRDDATAVLLKFGTKKV